MAHLRAVVAQAGLNLDRPEFDDGWDWKLSCHKRMFGLPPMVGLSVALQLKATENWAERGGRIGFSLDADTYDRLRTDTLFPTLLVVYTMPKSRLAWITHCDEATHLFHNAYWLDLRGQPPLGRNSKGKPRRNRTVYLPTSQRLTAGAILGRWREACEAFAPFVLKGRAP